MIRPLQSRVAPVALAGDSSTRAGRNSALHRAVLKTPILAALGVALAGSACVTERPAGSEPTFDLFEVHELFAGPPARIDLSSHPRAPGYRDELARSVRSQGPNFAGHYTIVEQACGNGCSALFVVDDASGRVFFPGLTAAQGFGYRRDSSLLIANPKGSPDDIGNSRKAFYRWSGDNFLQIQADAK